MTVLALNCGSPGGNSELLLKAALIAAEAAGQATQLIQVGPLALPAGRPGTLPPTVRDDRPWLVEQLISCDALIIASSVLSRSPSATLKLLVDRAFGPRVDVAAVIRAREGKQNGDPRHATTIVDERVLKPRVAGFISVGGATSDDWLTFGLPLMHMATFSMHIAVVDQFQVLGAAMPGTVLFDSEAMARAEALGRHVTGEIGKTFDEAVYHGAPGVCPVCHCDIIIPHPGEAECATCAARGVLTHEAGVPRLHVDAAGRSRSILTLEQKFHHQDEIDAVGARLMPRLGEVPALRARFDAFDRSIAPQGEK